MRGKRVFATALTSLFIACSGCLPPSSSTPSPNPALVPAEQPAEDMSEIKPSEFSDKVASPLAISFEDLDLGMEPDSVYEPWMLTTKVKRKLDQPVRITGFVCGAIFQLQGIREFPFMREAECPYGPGGQAHHVINVVMRNGELIDFTTLPITLEGNLTLQPFEGPNGKTWSLYRLDDAIVGKP